MAVVVKLASIDEITRKLGIQEGGDVQAYFTATCARYMDKYVPMDTGALAETVILNGQPTSNVTANSITYAQKYAYSQYIGEVNGSPIVNRSLDKHPLSTSYWDRHMMSAEKNDLIKEVADYAKRRNK